MPKPILQGPYRTFRRLNGDESYLEFEGSTITIPMRGRQAPGDPWMEEDIKLSAFMRLEIFPPYVNNLLGREFQFIIRDWYLYGKSPMLNRLFFNDPRGRWMDDHDDFVPAVVTFNVSNNYDVKVIDTDLPVHQIFGSTKHLEIIGLTSHHLRSWVKYADRDRLDRYSLPESDIHWQILSANPKDKATSEALTRGLGASPNGPVIVFHTKPSSDGPFRAADPRDRSEHLLALGSLEGQKDKTGPGHRFTAREPRFGAGGGLLASRVQLSGNTVLSPLAWPRQPLEIRWVLADDRSLDRIRHAVDGKPISGSIRIVSPSRSLGSAEQRPDPGDPIDSADFPARITYAINYDIRINDERFVEDQAGIAIAVGAQEIPPRDVTVAFDKPHVGRVASAYLEFGPGHCTGMHEIPATEYLHNVNFARYWRTVPLAEDGNWAAFQDFDPNVSY